jgi:hypothetical protein
MAKQPTYYDLSISQQILLYSQTFSLQKQINNIFSLILLDKQLDFDILRRAIAQGYQDCDTMRLRLKRVKFKMKQYFLDSDPPEIGLLDFTGKTQDEMDRELYRLAAIPIRLTNRPLHKTFLVRSWDGLQGIYVGVSHLAMDSWAICMLFKYIMDIYEALNAGTEMPAPFKPYEPLLVKDIAYAASPQHQKDLEFWQEECRRPEPIYTHVLGTCWLDNYRKKKNDPALRSASQITLDTHAAHEIIMIPAEQVAVMESYCREHRIPMQSLFLLGLRTVLSARNNREADICLYNAVARRGTQVEKRSGGTRIHVLFIRTIFPEDCLFLDALAQTSDRQSLMFRHAEFSFLDILKMIQNAYTPKNRMTGYSGLTLTFQPIPMALGDGTVIKTKWYGNGVSSQSFYLTVMDGDGTGALRCYYEYKTKVFQPEIVRSFHDEMVKAMMTGISREGITLGELLDQAGPAPGFQKQGAG